MVAGCWNQRTIEIEDVDKGIEEMTKDNQESWQLSKNACEKYELGSKKHCGCFLFRRKQWNLTTTSRRENRVVKSGQGRHAIVQANIFTAAEPEMIDPQIQTG